jgi:hypothetical protein
VLIHNSIFELIVFLIVLLIVYALGKAAGKRQGERIGRAEMAIELRAKSMRDNVCPICKYNHDL